MTEVLRVAGQPARRRRRRVLENGLALLQLAAERLEVSAAQVAQSLRMRRSSTYRRIDRLRTAGYLLDSATPGTFHLGLQAVPIGA